jgi:hypothetical protein
MTDDARKRIQAWSNSVSWEVDLYCDERFGDSWLEIYGEQSGFINEIGFDTYKKS